MLAENVVCVQLPLNREFYREMKSAGLMDKPALLQELRGEILDLTDELDYEGILTVLLDEVKVSELVCA